MSSCAMPTSRCSRPACASRTCSPSRRSWTRSAIWSIESWGGATFDACIRYLGEDPWERLRLLKAAMPKTPQQMLLRGQNLLGYRHYADDVVETFVERAALNGIDVFRIFDAMNDVRNLETSVQGRLGDRQARPRHHVLYGQSGARSGLLGRHGSPHSKTWAAIRSASRTWRVCSSPMSPRLW